jgi:hypothetical protein
MGNHKVSFNLDLEQYEGVQFNAGALKLKDMKSCYFVISFFVETEEDNAKRQIRNFFRRINNLLHVYVRNSIFERRFLNSITIPDTFNDTKRAFVSCEFTLFLKEPSPKTIVIKNLNELSKMIHRTQFTDIDEFKHRKYQRVKHDIGG